FAADSESSPAAIGRKRFFGCLRSRSTSTRSLTKYPALEIRQKATKVMIASSTSWDWLNLPEKSSPAKTKTFLIHSFCRAVLIAARSGVRCGTTGSSAGASASVAAWSALAGTVGCSEVIVSMLDAATGPESPQPNGKRRLRQPSAGGGQAGSISTPGL